MRYGLPRSLSPHLHQPFRRNRRGRHRDRPLCGTFGLYSDSEDDDDDADSVDSDLESSSESEDSFCYESESDVPPPPPQSRGCIRSAAEMRYIEDAIASIRLHVRHFDPYDEWERRMRREAWNAARNDHVAMESEWRDRRNKARSQEQARLADLHSRQVAEVQVVLAKLETQRKREEDRLYAAWKERDRKLWERIELVIKIEEDKVKAKLEAECKMREEAEKKKREEEAQRREEEERRWREEEAYRVAQELDEILQQEQMLEEALVQSAFGLHTAEEEWRYGRMLLLGLKAGPMKNVKSDPHMKSVWSASRRQITPKIGQLTNDPEAITRITQQIYEILIPPSGPHVQDLYHALLSSLSKAILLQAETEVTAEKRSAGPLAEVTANLLCRLPTFSDVFFAKLVQRVGGWAVPCVVPHTQDAQGIQWKDEGERLKAMGYRKSANSGQLESASEYVKRVSGMMRVYFAILKTSVPSPEALGPMFQMSKCWAWFARIMGQRVLLETAAAPQIIYVALEELGLEAKSWWGQQWMKILGLLHEGVTIGLGGDSDLGGKSAEGKAGRVRVQLEIERIAGW